MLKIKTTRKQPLSARSVWVSSPQLLAALSTHGHNPARGRAELDYTTQATAEAPGALDVEQILTLLIKEVAQCRAELVALKSASRS
jgi:hypothetical protein